MASSSTAPAFLSEQTSIAYSQTKHPARDELSDANTDTMSAGLLWPAANPAPQPDQMTLFLENELGDYFGLSQTQFGFENHSTETPLAALPPTYNPIVTGALDIVQTPPTNGNGYFHNEGRVHKRRSSIISARPTSSTSAPRKVQHMVIGIILSNGEVRQDLYRCHTPTCAGATFTRLADLKRHHACRHGDRGGRRPQFWCPVDGCECSCTAFIHSPQSSGKSAQKSKLLLTLPIIEGRRSMNGGGEAFLRKDKMMDHLERMHADKVGF